MSPFDTGSKFPFICGVEVPLRWANPFEVGFVGVLAGLTIEYTSPVTGFRSEIYEERINLCTRIYHRKEKNFI